MVERYKHAVKKFIVCASTYQMAFIDRYAARHGLSRSEFIRSMMLNFIRDQEDREAKLSHVELEEKVELLKREIHRLQADMGAMQAMTKDRR